MEYRNGKSVTKVEKKTFDLPTLRPFNLSSNPCDVTPSCSARQ